MFFLLRVAFWLSIVLVLLPSGGSDKDKAAKSAATQLNTVEAVIAASATVSDMTRFCDRQPDACAVGSQAAAVFGHRAQAGAKMVYEFINDKMSETGSVAGKPAASSPAGKASQNTLTAADRAPSWRGPRPIKEARGPA